MIPKEKAKAPSLGLIFVILFVLSFYVFWKIGLGRALVSSPPPALSVSPTATPAAGENQEGKLTLTGTITPLSTPEDSGTHKLVGAQGQVLAFLMSRKLDLNFTVPGVVVEVSGKVTRTLTDGTPLLQVESLKYRRAGEEK